ncbi:MAG: hydantoinase/oxoprolinase family protein [Candidatus Rokubacteria bacterium]|nr:hydantoinase/oxoprolinase family protein [Candidatus Rokubacteria bacterium]
MKWLGIDVGGTFTDLVVYDEATGELVITKTPSTPHDHSEGMMAGIRRLAVDLRGVAKLAHGTTIATNTVLERNGARTAVLVTRGFRDVLEVGRGNRVVLYNIKATRPPFLVPRSLCLEVDERTRFDGTVARELDAAPVEATVRALAARGIEAIAICFLHAYANDGNERAARAIVERLAPGTAVCTSSAVLPEYREYERFVTTVLNVYVAPRMARYLGALRRKLGELAYDRDVAIMTSNGGTMSVAKAVETPVHSMLSGPAAGVIGAVYVGAETGYRDLVTYDMGGTSTDACLVKDLEFAMTTDGRIGTLPNKVLQIEINSIGAGGGSVAWLGSGKFVNVGPRSAGASPGPACYGRGGTEPTVTDANVVLGRLAPGASLGGEITLDGGRAAQVVGTLAEAVGIDAVAMADGIVKIAVAKMTGAIKEISVMRGHDPRGFTLFAYGGAGPLHAALVARELGMSRVVVPPLPGNFSAFGLLVADVRHDYVRTRLSATRETPFEDVTAVFAELRKEAVVRLVAEGFPEDRIRFDARLDMRYVGQAFELAVPFDEAFRSMDDVEAAFRSVYDRRYAHATEDPAEIVSFRLSAYGRVHKPRLPRRERGGTLDGARLGTRPVAFDARFADTPVYARDRLPLDVVVPGPALVDEAGSTTVVPPGFRAWPDAHGNLVLEAD